MNDTTPSPLASPLVKLALTAAALFAAYKYGSPTMKALAIGAAGFMAVNQVPLVRDGLSIRLAA